MSTTATLVAAFFAFIVIAIIAGVAESAETFFIGILMIGGCVAWSTLRRRVKNLEKAVEDLERSVRRATFIPKAVQPDVAQAQTVPVQAPKPTEPPPAAGGQPVTPQAVAPPSGPAAIPVAPPLLPHSSPPRPGWTSNVRSALDLEEKLGVNWLSKIGVAILVLGIAFFLAWQLRELGPAGKVTVGILVSAALLGAGIRGERTERYRIPARAAMAGGWALLFFVSYAAHQVAAARVIDSPLVGFLAMLVVAGAMVAHTLRFRSQVVTGLAFGIAFTTIAINRVDVGGLVANVVLAIGFSYVVVRMRWYALEVLGILATYLNHLVWLIPIISAMNGRVHPFPQFYGSASILLAYWAIYRTSYVLRNGEDERTSALAAVANSALLLVVMKYQAAHPELAFYALLALGAVELSLSLLPNVRRRRTAFVVLTTLGTVLVVAAFPFRFAPESITPIWLIEASLLVGVGVLTDERAYRRLGGLVAIGTAVQFLSLPFARLFGTRIGGGPHVTEWLAGGMAIVAMLAYYIGAEVLPRWRGAMYSHPVDQRISFYLSSLGALMTLVAGWALFPAAGAAVFWVAVGAALAVTGKRDLVIQSNLLLAATAVRVLAVNLTTSDNRVFSVLVICMAIYAISHWNTIPFVRNTPQAARWIASGLFALLGWYELLPITVAVAWAALGIVLLEIGGSLELRDVRWQGYVVLLAAFVRVFMVNMNGSGRARIDTVLVIATAFLWAYAAEGTMFAWLAAMAILALLRFELQPDHVAIGWALLAVAAVAASLSGRRVFLHIGLATAVATLIRGVLHNLYERSWFPPVRTASTWLLVGGTAAILFVALPFAFRVRMVGGAAEGPSWRRFVSWLDRRPEHLLFLAPLLLVTVLLGSQMRRGMLTVAWGVEAVIVFVFALWVGERVYRQTGLALLLLCVGKIFIFDFWLLSLRDKALTGIVVGAALIGVSVLYTKKREAILQFL